MKRKWISNTILVTLLFSLIGNSSSVKAVEVNYDNKEMTNMIEEENVKAVNGEGTGLREETEEEKEWTREHTTVVTDVSLNELGQARQKEFQQEQDKLKIRKYRMEVNTASLLNDSDELPDAVDNSKMPEFPGVGNQGSYGTCASFSAIHAVTSHMINLVSGNKDHMVCSPKWTYPLICGGKDNGSSTEGNFRAFMDNGIVSVEDYPYVSEKYPLYREWTTDVNLRKKAQRYSCDDIKKVYVDKIENEKDSSLDNIKKLLNNGYIMSISTYNAFLEFGVTQDDDNTDKDDEFVGDYVVKWSDYANVREDGKSLGHALAVVGYNDNIWTDINGNNVVDPGEKGAFKILNSWGTSGSYTNNGFYWVAYDAMNKESVVSGVSNLVKDHRSYAMVKDWSKEELGAEFQYIIPTIDKEENIYAQFTLNSVCRENLNITLKAKNLLTGEEFSFQPIPLYLDGGEYALDGGTKACDSTFIYKLGHIVKGIKAEDLNNYTWTIDATYCSSNKPSYKIKDFKIVDDVNNKEYSADFKNPINIGDAFEYESKISITTGITLNTDKQSPQTKDTVINIDADVNVGSGNYLYNYKVISKDGEEEVLATNSSSSSVQWIPSATGKYTIEADIFDVNNNQTMVVTKEYNIADSLKLRKAEPTSKSATVNKLGFINISSYGGIGKHNYKVEIVSPINQEVDGYMSGAYFNWIPRVSGDVKIKVTVSDEIGNKASKTFDYTIDESEGSITSPTDLKYEYINGDKVRVSWSPSTSEDGYIIDEYKIYDNAKFSYSIKGTKECYYDIDLTDEEQVVGVMAKGSIEGSYSSAYSEMSDKLILPKKGVNIVSFTGNNQFVEGYEYNQAYVNDNINFDAEVKGGSGNYKYTYRVTLNGDLKSEYVNLSSPQFTWTPKELGSYAIKLTVEDDLGNKAESMLLYEIKDYLKITSFTGSGDDDKDPSIGYGIVDNTITFNTAVEGGIGKVKYKYIIRPLNATKYVQTIELEDAGDSITWIPSFIDTYEIEVIAEDERHFITGAKKTYIITK